MKPLKFLKNALVTGVLVVLPAWLAILLLLKVLVKLGVIVKPISGHLPEEVNHPTLVALATFLIICLLVGLLFRTTFGRLFGKIVEETVLDRIPGYAALRSIAAKAGDFDSAHDFQPALIDVEDGCLTPAFLIEEHDDGSCTVFIPSVPTPMAGSILIMGRDRVNLVDVTVMEMTKCISHWGSGSSKILKAMKPAASL